MHNQRLAFGDLIAGRNLDRHHRSGNRGSGSTTCRREVKVGEAG